MDSKVSFELLVPSLSNYTSRMKLFRVIICAIDQFFSNLLGESLFLFSGKCPLDSRCHKTR